MKVVISWLWFWNVKHKYFLHYNSSQFWSNTIISCRCFSAQILSKQNYFLQMFQCTNFEQKILHHNSSHYYITFITTHHMVLLHYIHGYKHSKSSDKYNSNHTNSTNYLLHLTSYLLYSIIYSFQWSLHWFWDIIFCPVSNAICPSMQETFLHQPNSIIPLPHEELTLPTCLKQQQFHRAYQIPNSNSTQTLQKLGNCKGVQLTYCPVRHR